jgi:hypothetical protein
MQLFCGDSRDVLPTIPDASVDAVICDPPYPEIDRDYGRLTEAEWFAMMDVIVPECRRVLKPTGSAVFVLQPNSERVGRMRVWLFEFMAKWGRAWGLVQDVWWWNITAMPLAGSNCADLLRPSLKACVWLGRHDCWRNQGAVLLRESEGNRHLRLRGDSVDPERPSRRRSPTEGPRDNTVRLRWASDRRGGVTPFNLLPVAAGGQGNSSGGHTAGTPLALCDWWTRYICPPNGTVLDPFMGSGTTGIAAVRRGCRYIGVECMAKYHAVAVERIREAEAEVATPLFDASEPAAPPARQMTFDDLTTNGDAIQ